MAHIDYDLPLNEFRARYTKSFVPMFLGVTLPALVSSLVGGLSAVDRLFKKAPEDVKTRARKLQRGFTDNVVVEMGIALHHLAKLLERSDFEDLDLLKKAHRESSDADGVPRGVGRIHGKVRLPRTSRDGCGEPALCR